MAAQHATEGKAHAAVALLLVATSHPQPLCSDRTRRGRRFPAEITPLCLHLQRRAEPAALACASLESAIIDLFRWSG